MSVDGTDFRVAEQGPAFSSHKFAMKSGLRYEVAICILTGDIVWLNGPFPCGRWNDIKIFRNSLMSHLMDGERVEADDGYIGEAPQNIKCPKCISNKVETLSMQQRVRNRQETANNRFKFWGILTQKYRHDITRHGEVFVSIAVITQLAFNMGEPLFSCGYKDPPYQKVVDSVPVVDDDDDLSYDDDDAMSH